MWKPYALGFLGILISVSLVRAGDWVDSYPSRPIRLFVSASPGGGTDLIARIVAEKLQRKWGQTVTVENRAGGGNNIAADFVYRSPPDGYTFLYSPPSPLVVNGTLYKGLKYDPSKLEPVGISTYIPNVLVVRGNASWRTAREFLAYAQSNPGKLNYGSQGIGTTGHLTSALLETLLNTQLTHVPYGGAAPALNDLVAGHIDFMFADLGSVLQLSQDGLIRLLAVTVKNRAVTAPDVPTIAEAGLPELMSDSWAAISAPPGTPLPIRQKMADAIREAILDPVIKERLRKIGVEALGTSPAEMGELVKSETARWGAVIRRANVSID